MSDEWRPPSPIWTKEMRVCKDETYLALPNPESSPHNPSNSNNLLTLVKIHSSTIDLRKQWPRIKSQLVVVPAARRPNMYNFHDAAPCPTPKRLLWVVAEGIVGLDVPSNRSIFQIDTNFHENKMRGFHPIMSVLYRLKRNPCNDG